MDIEKALHFWIEGAEKDFLAFQHLYENKDYPQCLFWGHLVIEKLLKGLILLKTKNQAPYSHDLVLLASKANLKLTTLQREQLNELNTLNQFARYDNEIVSFIEKCKEDFTEKYFLIIKDLYKWLTTFLQEKN